MKQTITVLLTVLTLNCIAQKEKPKVKTSGSVSTPTVVTKGGTSSTTTYKK